MSQDRRPNAARWRQARLFATQPRTGSSPRSQREPIHTHPQPLGFIRADRLLHSL
jgi:hypothetical protein